MLTPPGPIITAPLFAGMHTELISLLSELSNDDWQKSTSCSNWNVKDVALHLLGGEIGNLSRRRDGHVLKASIQNWDELVRYVNEWNESWVAVARRMSPRLLIDLLASTGAQMDRYFLTLDPFATGGPVDWAGPDPAPVWLDIAREYTERWHHQQHIRDAVGRPGLDAPVYLSPVLETMIRALPRAYQNTPASENTAVTLTITGPAGGSWSILRQANAWDLYTGAAPSPLAQITLDQHLAWRLFTRGIDSATALSQMTFAGDQTLGKVLLEMTSIIA